MKGYFGHDVSDPPELEAQVKQRAETEGLSAETWLCRIVGEIWADMPDEVRAKLPLDGGSEHDHYIYGLPKETWKGLCLQTPYTGLH